MELTAIYHRPESEYAYLTKKVSYISELERRKMIFRRLFCIMEIHLFSLRISMKLRKK